GAHLDLDARRERELEPPRAVAPEPVLAVQVFDLPSVGERDELRVSARDLRRGVSKLYLAGMARPERQLGRGIGQAVDSIAPPFPKADHAVHDPPSQLRAEVGARRVLHAAHSTAALWPDAERVGRVSRVRSLWIVTQHRT